MSSVSVRLRVGAPRRGSVPIALVVKAAGGGQATEVQWNDLAVRLSSSELGIDAVRDRVAIFGGRMKVRENGGDTAISLVLHDARP